MYFDIYQKYQEKKGNQIQPKEVKTSATVND